MTDSSEQWVRSMETVTAGETARIGGVDGHAKIEGKSGVGEPNMRLQRLAKVSILSRARNNREAGG